MSCIRSPSPQKSDSLQYNAQQWVGLDMLGEPHYKDIDVDVNQEEGAMEFGIFFVRECRDRNFRKAYEEMIAQTEYAEELGFDSVWLAEHRSSDYGSMPSMPVPLAALAMRTKRMRLGTLGTILPLHNPLQVAAEYAMVDNLSGGRVEIALGRGYQPSEFASWGMELKETREKFWEGLDLMIRAWTAKEPLTFHGKYYRCENLDLRPRPLQQPYPRVHILTLSPETFELVARRGLDMAVTPTAMPFEMLKERIQTARRILVETGRTEDDISMPFLVQVHVAPTREEARRRTEESVRWYFSTLLRLIPRGYEQYEYFTALAEQFTGEVDYDMIVNNSISWIGTPDDIAEKIRVVRDELGIRRFVAWFQFGGLDHRYVMDSMKLFAREVMPEFRSPQVPQAPVTAESRA